MSTSPTHLSTPSHLSSLNPSPLSTPGVESDFQGIEEVLESDLDTNTDQASELKVTFYPPLVLQRRVWILDILRKEGVTEILDLGCGEGQLLSVLSQPAPWLMPPPSSILPPQPQNGTHVDEIINLHPKRIFGLDISESDLAFAVQDTAPPPPPQHQHTFTLTSESSISGENTSITPTHIRMLQTMRWEELEAKIWLGGLEVVNEEFIDIQCIVSTEVIEHLPEYIFPFYAPIILGIYQPHIFLLTTPSYTFNARFTAPDAPPSTRNGFPDPTKRTSRIFRHEDHKFEWTVEEFNMWCSNVAEEWGYDVEITSIGRAQEEDPYGRDGALGGATQVAAFRRKEGFMGKREEATRIVDTLWRELEAKGIQKITHRLLARHIHPAHPRSEKPSTLLEIAQAVKACMEEGREAFIRLEELWFDPEISTLCGGWIEFLVKAIETSADLLLQNEGKQSTWMVELNGGPSNPRPPIWPNNISSRVASLNLSDRRDHNDDWDEYHNGERSVDLIPADWIPGEEGSCYGEGESSEGRDWESTAAEGDVSWNGSDIEDDGNDDADAGWGSGQGWNVTGGEHWGMDLDEGEVHAKLAMHVDKEGTEAQESLSGSGTSTAGWDGDKSEDTS